MGTLVLNSSSKHFSVFELTAAPRSYTHHIFTSKAHALAYFFIHRPAAGTRIALSAESIRGRYQGTTDHRNEIDFKVDDVQTEIEAVGIEQWQAARRAQRRQRTGKPVLATAGRSA